MVLIGTRTLQEAQPRRAQYHAYIRIPITLWGLIFLAAFLIALPSYDPLLTFACVAVLPLLATLIWHIGEPPVAFAALIAQWLQVSAGTFRATQNGVELNDLFHTGGANYATWLSLTGLIVLAAGIRVANLNRAPMDTGALYAEIQSYSYSRVLAAYCLAQGTNLLFSGMIWIVPGLAQALLAATQLRWLFYFILAVTTLVQKRGYIFLVAATAFEIVLGFTSFFSDFKTVFFVFAVSYLMVQRRINARMVISLAVLFSVLFYMGVLWSAVKTQYREYQNGGTGAQVSLVGPLDSLETLGQLLSNVDSRQFWYGVDALVERVEYTRYFGFVTDNVPSYIPYDDGAIWASAVYHVVTPRLFFPDKGELTADIDNTIRYTGLTFAGGGHDTEIPLGYMAESYIDFGPVFMFVAIFLLGLLYGAQYRYLATVPRYKLFAYGAMPVVLLPATEFGLTAAKILGGSLTIFAVSYIALWVFVPSLRRFILAKQNLARV
jgi:hypothetical protein